MNTKKSPKLKIRLFLIVAMILWCAVAAVAVISQDQGSSVDPIYPNVHPTASSDFVPYAGELPTAEGEICGLLLPAGDSRALSAAVASLAANETAGRIVLLALADNIGPRPLTTAWNYQTPFGVTRLDDALAAQWKKQGVVTDNRQLSQQPALAAAVTACGYYLSDRSLNVLLADTDCASQALAGLFPAEDTTVLVLPAADAPLTVERPGALEELLRLPGAQWSDGVGPAGTAALRALAVCLPASARVTVDTLAIADDMRSLSDLLIFWQED